MTFRDLSETFFPISRGRFRMKKISHVGNRAKEEKQYSSKVASFRRPQRLEWTLLTLTPYIKWRLEQARQEWNGRSRSDREADRPADRALGMSRSEPSIAAPSQSKACLMRRPLICQRRWQFSFDFFPSQSFIPNASFVRLPRAQKWSDQRRLLLRFVALF